MTIERGGFIPQQTEIPCPPDHAALSEFKRLADSSMRPMNLEAGLVNVFDIPPANGESTGPPVVLAQGFGVMKPRYRSMHEISQFGRRLLAFHPATRFGGRVPKMDDHFPEDVRRAHQIIEILDSKGIKHADLIGKSGGAAGSLIAGIARPELVPHIVLLNPNGLVGDRPRDITKRFLKKAATTKKSAFADTHPEVDLKARDAGAELITTLFANPRRTLDEISALGNTDLYGLMRRARDHGVLMSVAVSADDELFPIDKIFERMNALQSSGKEHDPFIGFYTLRGGHDSPLPDTSRIRLCLNALDKLKDVREKIFWQRMTS